MKLTGFLTLFDALIQTFNGIAVIGMIVGFSVLFIGFILSIFRYLKINLFINRRN